MARAIFSATFLLVTLLFLTTPIAANRGRDWHVKSYESIQKAINGASCGDTIYIEGYHEEQVVLRKDDITLIGKPGSKIVPPKKFDTKNPCYRLAGNETDINGAQTKVPTHAGICVFGKVKLFKFEDEHRKVDQVITYVQNPSISGLEVSGFNGLNIAVVGAQNAHVFENNLVNGNQYGFLTLGSKNTRAEKNVISSNAGKPFIALCMDDKSDVQIWNNKISDYFIGLCVQTNYADVKGNTVTHSCIGAFVDPGVIGAKLRYNRITDSAAFCNAFPFEASFGIIISGASKTEVRFNYITDIKDGANPGTAAGIAVFDNTGSTILANDNVIKDNFLKGNEVDIQIQTLGKGNVAKNNKCTTDDPPGVGGCS